MRTMGVRTYLHIYAYIYIHISIDVNILYKERGGGDVASLPAGGYVCALCA